MTLNEVIKRLEEIRDAGVDGDTIVKVYDPTEDENLGTFEISPMCEDEFEELWQSVTDAEAQAYLAEAVSEPGEVALTGELTKIIAIRLLV